MWHMNGGKGDTSYASNSLLPRKVISMTWPIAKEAIVEFFGSSSFPSTTLTMADLGCSSGPNTLMFVANLIKQVEDIGQDQFGDRKKPLEYQILLNDLHGNDFNGIFTSLPSFLQSLKSQVVGGCLGPCLFNGVPGSFYGRLFPTKSLHFVYSSYSLHWLSQVPKGIDDESNKGNVFIGSTTPKSVCEAYYKQFKEDFSMFLRCRAQEVICGGRMVLTMIGRTTEDPRTEMYCNMWGVLTLALNNMVAEGIVDEKKVDSFNIPNYMPCPSEVKDEILKEGSFNLQCLEVSKIDWNFYTTQLPGSSSKDSAYYIAKMIRSVIEPFLVHHFGEALDIEDLFFRYTKIANDKISTQKNEYISLTVSLTKIN